MMRYHEALSRCLEAVAAGDDLDAVIAGLPARHRERLRRDALLARAVRDHAAAQSAPSTAAEAGARARLGAELNALRASRQTAAPSRAGTWLGLPRFALAGLLLAALLIGAGFLVAPHRAGDGTVEAAEFEGVVVESSDGGLTVQTLDSLEDVVVPLDAAVMDETGAALRLEAIEAGEVVFVRGNREDGGPVRALDVRRRVDGLPGWCSGHAERCRRIADNLRDAQSRCRADPAACRVLDGRVTDLITHVTDVADLEDLELRCREGGDGCRDIASFCRAHPDACRHDGAPGPIAEGMGVARERLRQLEDLCAGRDTRACRYIAQLCGDHPGLCPDGPPRDAPAATPTTDRDRP